MGRGIECSSVSLESISKTMIDNYMNHDCISANSMNRSYIGSLRYKKSITVSRYLDAEKHTELLSNAFWEHQLLNKDAVRELINAALRNQNAAHELSEKEVDELIYSVLIEPDDDHLDSY